MHRRAAFTLVEMLIVMAIISTLAGMLLPSLATAREKGRRINCVGNLNQIGMALTMYCDDFGGYVPNTWPLNVPGDGYTGRSTNRLRQLPDMEMGLGKLVFTHQFGVGMKSLQIFGCPSHTPYLPKVVEDDWRLTGSVDSAYLYRELDASPHPDAFKRLAGRVKTPYAVVIDNSVATAPGQPQNNAHRGEWTNILYSTGHVTGALNTLACSRVTVGSPPNALVEVRTLFTHDNQPDAIAQVWRNADQEAEK